MRNVRSIALGAAIAAACVMLQVSATAGPWRDTANVAVAVPQAYGEFVAFCPYSHSAPNDPIVHPNMVGVSHMHDFLGNTSTSATSTVGSLLAATTTCDPASDLSSYWVPTLYDNTGAAVGFDRVTVYYIASEDDADALQPYPLGMKIVAGNAKATAPPQNGHFVWSCLASNMSSTTDFVQCPAGSKLELLLDFPDCWNGKDLDSPDHKSHMSYRVGAVCPASHPVGVPRLQLKLRYNSRGTPDMRLSSGAAYTIHGDFFNAWEPAAMNDRMRCLRDYVTCGPEGHPQAAPTNRWRCRAPSSCRCSRDDKFRRKAQAADLIYNVSHGNKSKRHHRAHPGQGRQGRGFHDRCTRSERGAGQAAVVGRVSHRSGR
jgi:hypothetical protein